VQRCVSLNSLRQAVLFRCYSGSKKQIKNVDIEKLIIREINKPIKETNEFK
jgi:hypothetical protein